MNFDQEIDRQGTYSFKWERYKGRDILPLWVADSEFRCAEPIVEALKARAEHGVYGYHLPAQYEPANQAVVSWLKDKHNWDVKPEWIVWTPGVVPAFNIACKAYCEEGDKVLIQTPNYPPMLAAPGLNNLVRETVDTVLIDGRWTLDFEQLEQKASDPKTKLFIMCNPMNPVGSVMSPEELSRVEDICVKHGVTLCSDEIHCDLILDETVSHSPAGTLTKIGEQAITLMAASKTFNVAGLGTSFAIIPNRKLRLAFTQAAAGIVPWVTVLGLAATEAAFTLCDDWHQAQIQYLRENRDRVVEVINSIDGLRMLKADATFLAWVDASGLGAKNVLTWAEEKGVGPSPGVDFHKADHFRINFGCSRAMLDTILARLSGS
jgi:cystathionine beta-lyase